MSRISLVIIMASLFLCGLLVGVNIGATVINWLIVAATMALVFLIGWRGILVARKGVEHG